MTARRLVAATTLDGHHHAASNTVGILLSGWGGYVGFRPHGMTGRGIVVAMAIGGHWLRHEQRILHIVSTTIAAPLLVSRASVLQAEERRLVSICVKLLTFAPSRHCAPRRLLAAGYRLPGMLSSMPAALPPVAAPRCAIIGRGCDPVRARFAEQHFSTRLGVDVDCATSDAELWEKMGKRQYTLFFLAPGACQLTRMGAYGGGDVVSRVRELQARPPALAPRASCALTCRRPRPQPHIKVVMLDNVDRGLGQIAKELGLGPVQDVKRNTEDWPFVD